MKGFSGLDIAAIMFLIVSIITIASFTLSIKSEVDAWRLTRITRTHANLMASEHMQDEIGIVDTAALEILKSLGYKVSAVLYDPENDKIAFGEDWAQTHTSNLIFEKDITSIITDPGYLGYIDGMGMPRKAIGYSSFDISGQEFEVARYALPVVYGDNNRYGVLIVSMSSEKEETWVEEYRGIYGKALEVYEMELEGT